MNSSFISTGRARFTLLALMLSLTAARTADAFFSDTTGVLVWVGESINLKVKGSSGGAKISLQSIGISGGGDLDHNVLSFPLNGTGSVNVMVTGVTPGTGNIFFSGTNNGGFVSLNLPFTVVPDPQTVAQNPSIGVAVDPVSTRTGEYFGHEGVDINLGGPMPLMFSRYVASKLTSDGMVQSNLGENRSHNFASRIINFNSTIKQVVLPSGRTLRFDKSGTKWILKRPLDVPFQLQETATEMLLADPRSKQIWTYDKAAGRLTKIEDGKGNAHTLGYTAGKLSSVSDTMGRSLIITQPSSLITSVEGVTALSSRTVSFSYTGNVLTSVTDYGGDVTTYANSAGLPTSHTLPVGNTPFSQAYTGGKVTSQTDRGTDTTTIAYDVNSTTVTDPLSNTRVDNYDAQGRLVSHEDELGRSTSMTYDSTGRRSTVTDRNGNKRSMVFHAPSGLPQTLTNAEGKTVTFTYKARALRGFTFHDLVKEAFPDGSSRSYAYDALGNLVQATDEAGKSWKYTYDAFGQVLAATNPLGGITINTYDNAGNLVSTQPPDTGATIFGYDERHRMTQITRPVGGTVTMTYDSKDRMTSVTDERTQTTQLAYDINNRLVTITDPLADVVTFGHDTMDRVNSVTDRLSKVSTLTFNSRRLPSSFEDRNGSTLSLNYDSRRRLTSFEDGDGHEWSFIYDNEGRIVSIQDPAGPPSLRKLNKLGYPTQVQDPMGNTVNLVRDVLQRVTGMIDPVGRLTNYAYDKRGLLVSVTEQGTGTAKYDRDALGNITKITDPNGGVWTMLYQKSGRLSKMTDPLGKSSTIIYDLRGRATNVTFGDTGSCALTHDAANNLTNAVYTGGPSLAFSYDDHGHLLSANDIIVERDKEDRITSCEQNGHDFTATYDDGGRLLTVGYFDGAFTVTYAYDNRGNLTSVTDSEGTSISMAYDDASRLVSQTRTPGIDGTYTYDLAGRLVGVQEGAVVTLNYELNGASEVTDLDISAPTLPDVALGTDSFKYGKAGQIITPEYAYDGRGRLTAAPGGKTYQWDGASRLVNAAGVTMTYNGVGDIITRTEAAQTTRFYHHYALALAPIVYEDRPSATDRVYVWTPSGRLLYSVDLATGDPTFYHFDRHGSTLALTDGTGAVTDSYAYGPYGEPLGRTGTSTQPFTYIGAYGVRTEGTLYDMRARYYDPVSATFLSRDPLPPRLLDPKSLNVYAYASQNPLLYVDPRGTSSHREALFGEHSAPLATTAISADMLGSLSLGGDFPLGPGGFHELNRGFPNGRRLSWGDYPASALDAFAGVPGDDACHDNSLYFQEFNAWWDFTLGGQRGTGRRPGSNSFGGSHLALPGSTFIGQGSSTPVIDPERLSQVSVGRGAWYVGGDFGSMIVEDIPPSDMIYEASNTAIAADTAHESQVAAAAREAVIQQLRQLYSMYQQVIDALLIKAQQNLSLTQDEMQALEAYKELRKSLKKVIKSLGGTVP